MRKAVEQQMQFGQVNIADIKFDMRCRDEIPKLLMGLQYIYCNSEIREEVFKVLEKMIPSKVNKHTGRPGMEYWKILVLGTIRLNCNWDYDKLQEMANNHNTLRQILGHIAWSTDPYYPLQTLKDNVSLFTEEILKLINTIVVKAGHNLVKKKTKH